MVTAPWEFRAVFLTDLDVRVISGGKFILLSTFVYKDRDTQGVIKVPKGFKTDFASIPRIMRWFITGQDDTRKPAVVHDYLYSKGAGRRIDADRIFLSALDVAGVSCIKRYICYLGVRIGGWVRWRDNNA